jgi:hypothetical protein
MIDICWWPSDPGWVKININGASKGGGVAGYVEELLEDGGWICGFNKV